MSVALDTLPDMRTFSHGSTLTDGGLALDLAPALTPAGLVNQPGFFHGFATHPVVSPARCWSWPISPPPVTSAPLPRACATPS